MNSSAPGNVFDVRTVSSSGSSVGRFGAGANLGFRCYRPATEHV